MNIKDLIITTVLAAFDRFMDLLTLGSWTQLRGSVVPNIRVKED